MHTNMRVTIVPLLLSGITSACQAPQQGDATVENAKRAMSEVSGQQTDTATLGTAVNTKSQKVFNLACAQGESELRGNSTSQLALERDLSFDDVLKTLDGSLSVGLNLAVVSAQASATIATKHATTSLSETYHLSWVGIARKEVFKPGTLQPSALGLDYANNHANLLAAHCGNEFVTEVHRGASFFATLKLDFLNSEDKLEVGGKISVNVAAGLVSADGSLKYVDQDKKKRTKLSVLVQQNGGHPERLLTILPTNLGECTLDNPDPCTKVFENLISYAKGDFAQQLQDPGQYNVLKYVTQSYADSGLDVLVPSAGYPVIEQAVTQKIALTEAALRAALADEERASIVSTTGAAWLTSQQLTLVQAARTKASNNIIVYADISRYCYDNMNQNCLTYAQTRSADIQTYSQNDLNPRPAIKGDANGDYCVDMADFNIFNASYGKTVADGADARADFNHDGVVDDGDYMVLSDHWGEGCSS